MKDRLGLGDLDPVFKVTVTYKLPNLSQNLLVFTKPPELLDRFEQFARIQHKTIIIW